MDLSRPIASVVPSLDGDVLMVLAGTTRPLTGREVGRLVRRGSWSGVRRVLHRLVDQGLVTAQEATPSMLYSLNRDHVDAPAVINLAGLRTEFFDRIRDQIEQWRIAPDSAAIFGSAARGDGSTGSDVDVFLVRPDAVDEDDSEWRKQVAELSAAISRWSWDRCGYRSRGMDEVEDVRRAWLDHHYCTGTGSTFGASSGAVRPPSPTGHRVIRGYLSVRSARWPRRD